MVNPVHFSFGQPPAIPNRFGEGNQIHALSAHDSHRPLGAGLPRDAHLQGGKAFRGSLPDLHGFSEGDSFDVGVVGIKYHWTENLDVFGANSWPVGTDDQVPPGYLELLPQKNMGIPSHPGMSQTLVLTKRHCFVLFTLFIWWSI